MILAFYFWKLNYVTNSWISYFSFYLNYRWLQKLLVTFRLACRSCKPISFWIGYDSNSNNRRKIEGQALMYEAISQKMVLKIDQRKTWKMSSRSHPLKIPRIKVDIKTNWINWKNLESLLREEGLLYIKWDTMRTFLNSLTVRFLPLRYGFRGKRSIILLWNDTHFRQW